MQVPKSTVKLLHISKPSLRQRTSPRQRRSIVTWRAPRTHRTYSLCSTPWQTWSSPTICVAVACTRAVHYSTHVLLLCTNKTSKWIIIVQYWDEFSSNRDLFHLHQCVQTGSHSQPKQMESVYAQKCTICTQKCTKIYISSTILKRIRERTQIRRKKHTNF